MCFSIPPFDTFETFLYLLPVHLQDDKDLVHEFVCSDGLDCLIKVGTEADQNHQNYILRGKYMSPVSYYMGRLVFDGLK